MSIEKEVVMEIVEFEKSRREDDELYILEDSERLRVLEEKEQCIKFHKLKSEEIARRDSHLWFSESDKLLIMDMDNERFLMAWNDLKQSVMFGLPMGLSPSTCIFCNYYDYVCDECEYSGKEFFCNLPEEIGWAHYIVFDADMYQKILAEALKL